MTRGETMQSKVHLKGQHDDFLVFVDDVDTFKKWKSDKSIPLAHFISSFQIFLTHKQGTQGTLNAASKGTLESEFDTNDEDEVIKKILEDGTMQTAEVNAQPTRCHERIHELDEDPLEDSCKGKA
ncbi:SDO1-like protein [Tolypocladium capitatum]|uniref:SDO1-like protein n=1 Tax=Tolypocladium capitatum TaxID=45235 RepID=A0A2K3QHK0_9HYPO|nr:SDO1-like protein [Tolypocladium capitatum]